MLFSKRLELAEKVKEMLLDQERIHGEKFESIGYTIAALSSLGYLRDEPEVRKPFKFEVCDKIRIEDGKGIDWQAKVAESNRMIVEGSPVSDNPAEDAFYERAERLIPDSDLKWGITTWLRKDPTNFEPDPAVDKPTIVPKD